MRYAATGPIAAGALFAAAAYAQNYPVKPVRLVVPFAAGGGSDFVARIVAQKFNEAFSQALVIDNRGGAGGAIGTELAGKSAPDGYTLLLGSAGPLTIQPGMSTRVPYDPIADFAPVTLVSSFPFVLLVHPSLPAGNVRD